MQHLLYSKLSYLVHLIIHFYIAMGR